MARATTGPFAGAWLLVWPDARSREWWVVADRPFQGESDLALWSAGQVAEIAATWGLEWQELTREEARLEARVFGIRPHMDPSAATSRAVGKARQYAPSRSGRLNSPGARWIGAPVFAATAVAGCGGAIVNAVAGGWIVLTVVFVSMGVPALWFACRAWWVSIEVRPEEFVVHGWYRSRSISRHEIVGAAMAPYPGQLVSILWVTLERHLVAIRILRVGGDHEDVPDVFGFPRQMRRVVALFEAETA